MNNDSNTPQAGQKSQSTQTMPSSQGSGVSTAGSSGASASALLDQATKAATDIAGQAKDRVGDQITSQLDAQKERAVGSIGGVADALRDAGRSLRSHDTGMPTEYVDKAADQIERLTGYVKNRTIGELAGDLERFARREPAIFLGGAFTLGVLAGRFLKSSSPRHSEPASLGSASSFHARSTGGAELGSGGIRRLNDTAGSTAASASPNNAKSHTSSSASTGASTGGSKRTP